MMFSFFRDLSYKLPTEVVTSVEKAISPYTSSSEKNGEKVQEFLQNASWTFSHRDTWRNREVIKKNSTLFAKFHRMQTPEGRPLFPHISDVMDFLMKVQNIWNCHQAAIFRASQKKSPLVFVSLEKTLQKINGLSANVLKKLAGLGYSKEELCKLIAMEGNLKIVAKESKRLPPRETAVMSILGQLDYKRLSLKRKVLVLQATEDWNGALGVYPANLGFYEILKSKFNTKFRKVNSVENLKAELLSAQKDKPNVLIIEGHGMQESLELSKNQFLSVDSDMSELKNLPKKTIVILSSCSTGEGKNKEWNLANHLSCIAPHIKIFAPTCPASTLHLLSSGKPIFARSQDTTVDSLPNHFLCQAEAKKCAKIVEYSPNPKEIQKNQKFLQTAYKAKILRRKIFQAFYIGAFIGVSGIIGHLAGRFIPFGAIWQNQRPAILGTLALTAIARVTRQFSKDITTDFFVNGLSSFLISEIVCKYTKGLHHVDMLLLLGLPNLYRVAILNRVKPDIL